MITIYKYPITKEEGIVEIPSSAKLLKIDYDGDRQICAWALIDSEDTNMVEHKFHIFGTGWDLGDYLNKDYDLAHLATLRDMLGYIWHVFEEIPKVEISQRPLILTPDQMMQLPL